MERGAFMRKTEVRPKNSGGRRALGLLLGGLLALGVELVILLLGSAAVSLGVLRNDATIQITAVACIIGGFVGGSFVCAQWTRQRLLAGILTGVVCILLIMLLALIGGNGKFGTQMLVELASCLVGGGLAGALAGKKKKKHKSR